MAAVLTGTPVTITWAAGANPAGQSITIPSDATAVYMFWCYFDSGGSGYGLSSATLNSANPDQTHEHPGDNTVNATGVAVWYNPSTGSQTLDPAWDSAPTSGATCTVYYIKDGDTTAWTDADSEAAAAATAVSVTLTTDTDELVIKFDTRDSGTAPSNSSGWTSDTTQTNNSNSSRAAHITPSGTTQACPCEDENYSSIVAVSIPPGNSPVITDVNTTESWDDGDTGLVITGTDFV
jgi:hypothetical protein